jgi:hypothetical protein
MAGFALQLARPKGRVGILGHGMLSAKYAQRCLVIMALKTRVSTLAAVIREFSPFIGLGMRGRGCGGDQEGHRQNREYSCCHSR